MVMISVTFYYKGHISGFCSDTKYYPMLIILSYFNYIDSNQQENTVESIRISWFISIVIKLIKKLTSFALLLVWQRVAAG